MLNMSLVKHSVTVCHTGGPCLNVSRYRNILHRTTGPMLLIPMANLVFVSLRIHPVKVV